MTPAQRFFLGGDGGASAAANAGLLILRLMAGLALAFAHGINKIPPSPRFIEGVAGMGFPLPEVFAWAAGVAEFGGGLLLAVGLLTRPASLLILFTMATAFFLRHADDPFSTAEKAFLVGGIAILFLFAGAGRFSLDALIRGRKQERVVRRFVRG